MLNTNHLIGDALISNEENVSKHEMQENVTEMPAVQECAGGEEVTEELPLPENIEWLDGIFPDEGEPPEEEIQPLAEAKEQTTAPCTGFFPVTRNLVIETLTDDYLSQFADDDHPDPADVERTLLGLFKEEFIAIKANDKSVKWPVPSELPNAVIADILVKLHGIVRLRLGTETQKAENDPIGIYMPDGPDKGTYSTDETYFASLCLKYNYSATDKDCAEIYKRLKKIAPCVQANDDPNLIAVNNGIFNYKTR